MKWKHIPVEKAFKEWHKDPEYVAAYDALEKEFSLASALIKARGDADLTQEQVAAPMGTTQAFVARLESGRTLPSTRTLERFAKATHQLRAGEAGIGGTAVTRGARTAFDAPAEIFDPKAANAILQQVYR